MGRIADALKKAQLERSARIGMGGTVAAWDVGAVRSASGNGPRGVVERSTGSGGALRPRTTPRSGRPRYPAVVGPMPHWDVDPTVAAVRDRTSPVTEQYRAVRTW